jgi:hypothetical protein
MSYRNLRRQIDDLIARMVNFANANQSIPYHEIGRKFDMDSQAIRYYLLHRGGVKRKTGRKP